MGMPHSYNDDLRLAHVLADNADALSMERFHAVDLQVSTKPDMTYVTDADTGVEETIRRTLKSARTRDAVLGEERGSPSGSIEDSERRWIIDPIDGTANYVRGVPVWATLIALADGEEVVASCVSAPALGRRWWASKGGGAFTGKSLMNAKPCRVSKVDDIADALFAYSSLGDWEHIGKLDQVVALMRRCWRTRGFGDFWSYMLLAEGAVDIAAEPELAVWDMAALDVIVREAGGSFSGLDGRNGPWGRNALASNTHLHDAAMAYLGHFPDTDGSSPWPVRAAPVDNVRQLDKHRRPDRDD